MLDLLLFFGLPLGMIMTSHFYNGKLMPIFIIAWWGCVLYRIGLQNLLIGTSYALIPLYIVGCLFHMSTYEPKRYSYDQYNFEPITLVYFFGLCVAAALSGILYRFALTLT